MTASQPCTDLSDLIELSRTFQLYLKPEARISVTVALPNVRLPGRTISNWEVMERLRQMVSPEEFTVIKVAKTTLEFIRFDAEIENRSRVFSVIGLLDGKSLRISGFPEPLKIRAAEAKPDCPTRHHWDKFFRDNKYMNEMKAGERPDTLHLQGLPKRWFASDGNDKPSECVVVKIFQTFGDIRCADIPTLDPYRQGMKASISGLRSSFSNLPEGTFDAFIQYHEYICFVKAMEALRGMKLVFKDGVKAYSASIKVDFDKTKHLSDLSIRRRAIEREKLMAKEREKEEAKRREEEAVQQALEEEERRKQEEKRLKSERRKEREEKRKQRILKKLRKREAEQMSIRIAIEERKLLMAQRKLESIRLLDELFERVKVEAQKEMTRQKEIELDEKLSKVKMKNEEKQKKKELKEQKNKEKMLRKEKKLRKKLVSSIKKAGLDNLEQRKEKLRKTIEGKEKLLKQKKTSQQPPSDEEQDLVSSFPSEKFPIPYGFPTHNYLLGGFPYPVFRGRFFPRRPYGVMRGGHFNPLYWDRFHRSADYEAAEGSTAATKTNNAEENLSDASSSATSKYSISNSSDSEKKVAEDLDEKQETHPWIGYSDFYNPHLLKNAVRGRRPFIHRGLVRGGGPPASRGMSHFNPNVPTRSFYMSDINQHYYKYFSKLAGKKHRRSRSHSYTSSSSERKICRKVRSRTRSRTLSNSSRERSRSRSRHRRTKSKSTTRSKSRSRSRSSRRRRSKSPLKTQSPNRRKSNSNSKSPKKSRSRSKSKSPPKRRSLSRSPNARKYQSGESKFSEGKGSGSPNKSESPVKEDSRSQSWENNQSKSQPEASDALIIIQDDSSDLSLSLGSDGLASPSDRKEKPIDNPQWKPSPRKYSPIRFNRSPRFRPRKRSNTPMRYRPSRERYPSISPVRDKIPSVCSKVVKCEPEIKRNRRSEFTERHRKRDRTIAK